MMVGVDNLLMPAYHTLPTQYHSDFFFLGKSLPAPKKIFLRFSRRSRMGGVKGGRGAHLPLIERFCRSQPATVACVPEVPERLSQNMPRDGCVTRAREAGGS